MENKTDEQLGEDPKILKEQQEATKRLADMLKRHEVEVDYCEADWRDTKDLIESAHALILKHPGWSLYYFSGDTWGIDSNYVFFTSRPVPEELVEMVGRYIVDEGAELPQEVIPPKPKCPRCGAEIESLVGYYSAVVTGYVKLSGGNLDFWLDDDINDLKDIIDNESVSWHCSVCNEELFRAGEECEDEILALLKCEHKETSGGQVPI